MSLQAPKDSTNKIVAEEVRLKEQKPKKICCACPETKKARDACIVERGEDKCHALIEAHLKCLRDQGFNI